MQLQPLYVNMEGNIQNKLDAISIQIKLLEFLKKKKNLNKNIKKTYTDTLKYLRNKKIRIFKKQNNN